MAKGKQEKPEYNLSLIEQKHILDALKEIDEKGIPKNAQSSTYDLVYNGKPYPPKLVLSWSYRYATGDELDRNLFEGGKNTPCFNRLQELGFVIKTKEEYMDLIFRKEVDYSMLVEGMTITNDVLPRFLEIYGEVELGKSKKINVLIEDNEYQAEFRHINLKNAPSIYSIRYPKNGDISEQLKLIFPNSFEEIKYQRAGKGDKKKYVKLPSDKKEYLLIYYNSKNKELIWQKEIHEEGFYPIIQKFVKQADEGKSLKVSEYPKSYEGLEIKVSFGQGGYALTPWISFLYQGQTTSNGIYPCFLYYKQQKILILSYGVSETIGPNLNWELPATVPTINIYFEQKKLGTPNRYGKSQIFKVYSIDSLSKEQIENDLSEIISVYKNLFENESPLLRIQSESKLPDNPFIINRMEEIGRTGLLFNTNLMYRYAVSLLTKPFVILSGLSGSGKTKLALSFAKWLAGDKAQVKLVSVGSDWNNREYLLGYPNALESDKYVKPDNGVLDFIIQASRNPSLPFFLILDEMNLSYVERYFADFLSCMESHEEITLHPGPSFWNDVPPSVALPTNLYITGTINVDETTYMFSPKVLDRANVIEFRINQEDMEKYLNQCKPLEADIVNGLGSDMQLDFVRLSKRTEYKPIIEINQILLKFFTELKKAGAEFGYRTANEIYRYVAIADQLDTNWEVNQQIDIVIMQKLLPKLHGSRKKMQPVLSTLWDLCKKDNSPQLVIDHDVVDFENQFIYPLSAAKIHQMYKNAQDNGFTSYAEA